MANIIAQQNNFVIPQDGGCLVNVPVSLSLSIAASTYAWGLTRSDGAGVNLAPTVAISNVSNPSPTSPPAAPAVVVYTTSSPHGFTIGQSASVFIWGVGAPSGANGQKSITATDPTHFYINGSNGGFGPYTSGGTFVSPIPTAAASSQATALFLPQIATNARDGTYRPPLLYTVACIADGVGYSTRLQCPPAAFIGIGNGPEYPPTVTATCSFNGPSNGYAWSLTAKPSGSTAALSGTTVATPTFQVDVFGDYSVQFNDGNGTIYSVNYMPDSTIAYMACTFIAQLNATLTNVQIYNMIIAYPGWSATLLQSHVDTAIQWALARGDLTGANPYDTGFLLAGGVRGMPPRSRGPDGSF